MTRLVILALLAACAPPPVGADAGSSAATSTDTPSTGTSGDTPTTGDAPTTATTGAPADGLGGDLLDIPGQGVALDDLDGDGHLDLVRRPSDAAVQVTRGRGDGSFDPPILLGDRLDNGGSTFAFGDLDGDGLRDTVVLGGHATLVRGGLGDAFETLHFKSGSALAVRDADLDGYDDLFLTSGNTLRHYRGDASGYLLEQPLLGLGGEPMAIAAADLDGDNALDLVVANSGTDDLSLLRGDGDGGFLPQVLISVGDHPGGLAIADLDADGQLDLAVVGVDGVVTLRGLGDAQFAPPVGTALPTKHWAATLVVCHLDDDPFPDAVAAWALNYDGWLLALHGTADARFVADQLLLDDRVVYGLACGDVDEDGLDDLIYEGHRAGDNGNSLWLWRTAP